jgi:hypothetical protein
MTPKNVEILNHKPQASTCCPLTGMQVLDQDSKQFPISDLNVIWWHCLSCKGWHLLMTSTNQEDQSLPIERILYASSL